MTNKKTDAINESESARREEESNEQSNQATTQSAPKRIKLRHEGSYQQIFGIQKMNPN